MLKEANATGVRRRPPSPQRVFQNARLFSAGSGYVPGSLETLSIESQREIRICWVPYR
jgi:hypothetical protein